VAAAATHIEPVRVASLAEARNRVQTPPGRLARGLAELHDA